MQPVWIEWSDLQRIVRSSGADAPSAVAGPPSVLVVELDGVSAPGAALDEGSGKRRVGRALPRVSGLHALVVGVSRDPELWPESCDVVIGPDGPELDVLLGAMERHPVAAMTLIELLRCAPGASTSAGLLAESASYGVLQAGREFATWRRDHPRRAVHPDPEPVLARRAGDELQLTLHRPERRNALDAAMRDALAEQLQLALVDRSITRVVIDGDGPDFCSGGDLDEFGTASDAAVAHLVRLERSLGRLLAAVADRLTVRLHGACIGSGIELAAFAGTVEADPSTSIALPELAMGLIPGAGGTVSITRRIGRHRTCWLALSGQRIDAATALEWGLVDGTRPSTDRT